LEAKLMPTKEHDPGEDPGEIRILNRDERRVWQQRIKDTVDASPLVFDRAEDGNAPFHLEVTNGQAPGGGKTLVIHVFKRADIDPGRAQEIVQSALVEVFGPTAGAQAECDYRDVKELRAIFGDKHLASETHDSLTIIFPPGPISYSRRTDWVRDRMAAALFNWYRKSMSW
jgi:hypothetical protein